jgi:MFS family permease
MPVIGRILAGRRASADARLTGRVRRPIEVIAPARLGQPFRWLLASSWLSNLGDGLTLSAGPLLVAAQTHDPFLVSLAVVLQRLPWLLFGLHAGVIADRLDRRSLLLTVQLLRAVVLTALAASILTDHVGIGVVLLVMFLLGTAETFADTTSQTLLPMVVQRRDLALGNARLMAGFVTVNQLAGPPVGAALFALDPVLPFVAEAVCILVSAGAIAKLVLPPHGVHRDERGSARRDIVEGLRWLWGNAAVRTLSLTIVTFNVTFGAAWSVLVLYAIERLRTGDVGFGLLTTATAIGGILGTLTYDRLARTFSLGGLMRIGLIIETGTHLVLALTTSAPVALVVMVVFGAHAFVWGTTSRTVRQRAVPDALQGRVSSAYLIGVQGGMVVGGAIGGVIAGIGGVTAPFWFAFVGSAALVLWIWPQLPHIAHDDEEDEPAAR